jgi:hypothetical protein
LPLWFAAMVLVEIIFVMRVFTEMISIEALAVVLIAFNWFQSPTEPQTVVPAPR